MEQDQTGVNKIEIEHDLMVSCTASRPNKQKIQTFKDSYQSVYGHISKQETDLSSLNTSMGLNIPIKQDKKDDYNQLDKKQEWVGSLCSSVQEASIKKKQLNEIAHLTAAEDMWDDSRSCDSSETLPEHLSDFATPLMEMEVLETDETSNTRPDGGCAGRSKNGCRRRRNKARFARTKASKVMGKGCENCRSKCHVRISEAQRQIIFDNFWSLEDAGRQWQFIDMHTRTKETERKTTNWQSNRKISRTYYFDLGGNEVKVCQVMFLSTLGVSEKWVRNLVQTLKQDPGTSSIEENVVGGMITRFDDASLASSRHSQDEISSLVVSEEETSNRFLCGDNDSCDSKQTVPERGSDCVSQAMEVEVGECAEEKCASKSKSESKWKRGGKVMGKGCENCRAKCHLKISEAQRSCVFEHFWNLRDAAKQWQFIALHTKTKETERKTTNWHSNRKVSRSYYFDVNHEEVKVCQVMFLSTLGVSEKWIKTALSKKDQDLFPDRRGKHRKRVSKLKGPVLDSIIEHIKLFERCQDCREILNKVCLPENLSLRKMYEFYVEFMNAKQQQLDDEAIAKQQKVVLTVATERQYRDTFKKEFNIPFHPPRKGQCELCVAGKPKSADVKDELTEEMEEHIRNKDAVREMKDSDKVEAVKESSVCLASFDSQRIGLPCGEVPAFYYADRLNLYNFSVFDIGRSQAYCYVWHEEIAKRGSNESGSCLMDFVEKRVNCGVVDFRFYTDSCSLLKKNKYIFGLWHFLAVKHALKITHRFLENGHTLTEGHVVLTDIERKTRKQSVYTPQEALTLIKDLKDNRPFIVKAMDQEGVYDLEDLLSGQNWTKDACGSEIKWSDVREVQVSGESPGIVKFRYDFLSEYLILQIGTTGTQNVSDYEFKQAFDRTLPLTKAKKDGLIDLCTKNLIPADRQHFYHQLTTNSI